MIEAAPTSCLPGRLAVRGALLAHLQSDGDGLAGVAARGERRKGRNHLRGYGQLIIEIPSNTPHPLRKYGLLSLGTEIVLSL